MKYKIGDKVVFDNGVGLHYILIRKFITIEYEGINRKLINGKYFYKEHIRKPTNKELDTKDFN